jgi:lipopolysaccharide biosynthesis regulator YciM
MRITEVLPDSAGDVIFLPLEFTALTGADFDIDKLFTMGYYYDYTGGKLNKIEFAEPEEGKHLSQRKLKEMYRAKLRELYEQALRYKHNSITEDLVSNVDMFGKPVTPLTKVAIEHYKSILRHIKFETQFFTIEEELDILDRLTNRYNSTKDITEKTEILEQIDEHSKRINDIDILNTFYEPILDEIMRRGERDAYKHLAKVLRKAGVYMTFENFKGLSIEEQNTIKATKNRMLDMLMTVLKDPKHAIDSTTPLGSVTDIVKHEADLISELILTGSVIVRINR